MMNATSPSEVPVAATADDIRKIIGPFEDDVVVKIMEGLNNPFFSLDF
jgi:hypothetical protein